MTADSVLTQLVAGAATLSGWELTAVVLGVAYLLLAVRESLWCWYAAFFSTAIFLWLFWQVGLLMESALQVYYLGMALYGWQQWRGGGSGNAAAQQRLPISVWPPQRHILAIASVLLASAVSGALLDRYTGAVLPYIDSFTTWGSILTTWMVAKKLLENWLYWLVIDSVSIYLYLERGLFLTAALFAVYLVIVVFGYRRWHRHYRLQCASA